MALQNNSGGGASGANPTQAVGLTPVNGTAITFMRSDGAPALSQAIAPVWTGLHTFQPSLTTPSDAILFNMSAPGASGTRDSHRIIQRGGARDTSPHTVDWQFFVDVNANAGGSTYVWQNRIDAAAYATIMALDDLGNLTLPNAGSVNAGVVVAAVGFTGNGSGLTALPAAQLTGALPSLITASNIVFTTGSALATDVNAGNTLLVSAYDTDLPGYVDFLRLTANNSPSLEVLRPLTWASNAKQTFTPSATVAGINVGSLNANPSAPANGDLYYNTVANELRARINSTWIALGAGGAAAAGATGNVQYNNGSGGFAAESAFSYNSTTDQLLITGTISTGSMGVFDTGNTGVLFQLNNNGGTPEPMTRYFVGGSEQVRTIVSNGFRIDSVNDTVFLRNGLEQARINATGLVITPAGKKLQVKEGSNAAMGIVTLVAGTATVTTTAVLTASRIFLTGQNSSGTAGNLTVSARVNGTSFTITSSSGTDTRDIAWHIIDPAP